MSDLEYYYQRGKRDWRKFMVHAENHDDGFSTSWRKELKPMHDMYCKSDLGGAYMEGWFEYIIEHGHDASNCSFPFLI